MYVFQVITLYPLNIHNYFVHYASIKVGKNKLMGDVLV